MVKKDFSKRLNELMEEHKLKPIDLARKIKVSEAEVCYWRTSRTTPGYESLKKLKSLFNTTSDYLLGFTDEK